MKYIARAFQMMQTVKKKSGENTGHVQKAAGLNLLKL